MKKTFTVLAIIVLVCASVFAGNKSVRAHVAPVTCCLYLPMLEGDYVINADAEINWYINDNFRAGALADAHLAVEDEDSITLVGFPKLFAFAKAGYVFDLSQKWAIAADLGLGFSCVKSSDELQVIPAANLSLTGVYKFNNKLALDFGLICNAFFSISEESSGILPFISPSVGIECKF